MQTSKERLLKYLTQEERTQYEAAQAKADAARREIEEARKRAAEAKEDIGGLSDILRQREKAEKQFWKDVDKRHENVFSYLCVKYPDLLERELAKHRTSGHEEDNNDRIRISDDGSAVAGEDARADVSASHDEEPDDFYRDPADRLDLMEDNREAVLNENSAPSFTIPDGNEKNIMQDDKAAPDTDKETKFVPYVRTPEKKILLPSGGTETVKETAPKTVKKMPADESDAEEESDTDLKTEEEKEDSLAAEEEPDVDLSSEELPETDFLDDEPEDPDPVDVKDEPEEAITDPSAKAVLDFVRAVDAEETSQRTAGDSAATAENVKDGAEEDEDSCKNQSLVIDFDSFAAARNRTDEVKTSAENSDLPDESDTLPSDEPGNDSENHDESEADDEGLSENNADTLVIHDLSKTGDLIRPVRLLDGTDVEVTAGVEKGFKKLLVSYAEQMNNRVLDAAGDLKDCVSDEEIDREAVNAMKTVSAVYDEAQCSFGNYQIHHQFSVRPEICRKWSDVLYRVFDAASDYLYEKVYEKKNGIF